MSKNKVVPFKEWYDTVIVPEIDRGCTYSLERLCTEYAQYYHSQMTAPQDGFIKVEHFPTGENNSDFPEWLASSVIAGLVESGKTKDEVVNELLISLCVKAAYETGTSPAILDSLRQEKDAVEFAEWIAKQNAYPVFGDDEEDVSWSVEREYKPTADLYRQFKSK